MTDVVARCIVLKNKPGYRRWLNRVVMFCLLGDGACKRQLSNFFSPILHLVQRLPSPSPLALHPFPSSTLLSRMFSTLLTVALFVAPAIQGVFAGFAINSPALVQVHPLRCFLRSPLSEPPFLLVQDLSHLLGALKRSLQPHCRQGLRPVW